MESLLPHLAQAATTAPRSSSSLRLNRGSWAADDMGMKSQIGSVRCGLLSLTCLVLALAAPALAQNADGPARGGVGVVQGQVGVSRTPPDDRSTCARDRLVGQRPQVGVQRNSIGVARTPTLGAPTAPPSDTVDPCSSDASADDSGDGVMAQLMNGLLDTLRFVPRLLGIDPF